MSRSSRRRNLVRRVGTGLWLGYLAMVFGLTGLLLYTCWRSLRP